MGGGTTTVSAYYGTQRKTEISMAAIRRTGQTYGVRIGSTYPPRTRVVSEKMWEQYGLKSTAAFYRDIDNTLYIRRKYFAGRKKQYLW